jgi:hypothetical protein
MAEEIDAKDLIKQDLKEYFDKTIQTESVTLDAKGMKQEGADTTADYIYSRARDVMDKMLGQTVTSTDFFPIVLDPNIYDQGALFQMTPSLTYLENKGRRFPADSTKFNYIEFGPAGFTDSWIGETDSADNQSDPNITDRMTQLGVATMCFHVVPFSLSDIIGAGQSVGSRAQIMQLVQETLREGLNNALLNGNHTSHANQYDGLITLANASNGQGGTVGWTQGMAGNAPTLDDVRQLEADLALQRKGYGTFMVMDNYTHNYLMSDMTSTVVNMQTGQITNYDDIVAGIDVTGWQSARGKIPIIVDPFSPSTAYSAGSPSTTGRHLGLYNERNIFMHDLITPSWVEKGKTKPLATDGWVIEANVMYNTIPSKTADMFGIK